MGWLSHPQEACGSRAVPAVGACAWVGGSVLGSSRILSRCKTFSPSTGWPLGKVQGASQSLEHLPLSLPLFKFSFPERACALKARVGNQVSQRFHLLTIPESDGDPQTSQETPLWFLLGENCGTSRPHAELRGS